MSDSGRPPSEREIERGLRDLGARIEYPPTPDVASSVRRRLEEDERRGRPGRGLWQFVLSPRWSVPIAALVLLALALLTPTVRETLFEPFLSEQATGSGGGTPVSEDAGSAARPESGGPGGPSEPDGNLAPQTAGSGAGDARAQDVPTGGASGSAAGGSASAAAGAVGCPSPYLRIEPARAEPGATFRLRGNNFTAGCERIRPAKGVRIDFRQGGERWRLTSVDADRDLSFETRLRVPAGAGPGRATVRATIRPGESVEKRFVVLR